MESDSVCNHTSDYKIGRPRINHKDYNFREAKEMKIFVGNTGYQITDNFENN